LLDLARRNAGKIARIEVDPGNGYWIYLRRHWHSAMGPGEHWIHEQTARETVAVWRIGINRCECRDCQTGEGWSAAGDWG